MDAVGDESMKLGALNDIGTPKCLSWGWLRWSRLEVPSDHTKWKAEVNDTVISIFSGIPGGTEESTECVVRTRT